MSRAITLTLAAAALLGCDGAVIGEDFPHHPPAAAEPAACVLPRVGSTCPAPIAPVEALAFVQAAAWCPAQSEMVVDERPGGDVELACSAPGWRIVVGVVAAAWGVAFLADDGALVVCVDGRVDAVLPLLVDETSGRHWHRLSDDDGVCLDAGLCAPAFDQCEAPR